MLINKITKGNKNLVVLHTDADQVVDEACVVAAVELELRLAMPEPDGGFHPDEGLVNSDNYHANQYHSKY